MSKGPHKNQEELPAEPDFSPEDVHLDDRLEIRLGDGPVQFFIVRSNQFGPVLLAREGAPQGLAHIPLTEPAQILDLNDPKKLAFYLSSETLAALIGGGLEVSHQNYMLSHVHHSPAAQSFRRKPSRSPDECRLFSQAEVAKMLAQINAESAAQPPQRAKPLGEPGSDSAPTTFMPADQVVLLIAELEQERPLDEKVLRQILVDIKTLVTQASVGIRRPDREVVRPAVLRLVAAQHQMPDDARADLEAVIVAFERKTDEVSQAAFLDLRTAFPKALGLPARAKKLPWWKRILGLK